MSRRALGLVLLALGATASHWPRGGRWVSVRGGAQDASSSASKKKEHKKLFENAERAQAERQTGKLKSGSKIELGARSGGSHFLGFLWASTTKVLRGIARLFGFSVRAATKPKKAEAAKGASGALKAHLESAPAKGSTQRIVKELREFVASPPDGCEVSVGKNLKVWIVTLTGADGTVFEGEKYKLRIEFPSDYPLKPPSCYFLQPTPRHPHVYTNGDICLSLLGKGWRPNLSAQHIALSILSMLSSVRTKGLPQDNAAHADATPGKSQDNWMYHDDSC